MFFFSLYFFSIVKPDFFGYNLPDVFFLSFTPGILYSYASCGSLVNQTLLCYFQVCSKVISYAYIYVCSFLLESSSSHQGFNLKRWMVSARKMRQPLSFLGVPTYFKFKILFYTFTKTLDQRFDIFSPNSPRFIIPINHCCSSEFLLQRFSWNQLYHLLSTFFHVSYG